MYDIACQADFLMGSLNRCVGSSSCSIYSPEGSGGGYNGRLNCRRGRSDELVTSRLCRGGLRIMTDVQASFLPPRLRKIEGLHSPCSCYLVPRDHLPRDGTI